MSKISIPISMNTLLDGENLPRYLDDLKRCDASRVFLCGMGNIYTRMGRNYTQPEAIRRAIDYFRAAGLEVGIWISAFGHGSALMPELAVADEATYTQITDISGYANEHYSNCPLDENFRRDYCEGVRRIAELSPDLIMLDDDFRLNGRPNIKWGCFCPLHLAQLYKKLGEEIPRDRLETLLLSGGRNPYRSALLEVFRDSMLDFVRALRDTIDAVNPDIRLGICECNTWDMIGTNPIEIAQTAAGKTKPFLRIGGAPYHNVNIIPALESARQRIAWGEGSGVEIFTEGDTYPRPRHNVPSKTLELFDFLLLADGTEDGILAYLEDYHCAFDYERGYVERFVRNLPIRDGIRTLFKGKRPVGVRVVNVPNKMEDWDLGEDLVSTAPHRIGEAMGPVTRDLLSANSIPTCYTKESDYPLYIIGENARHVDPASIRCGAILDASAAKILEARGVDTGLIAAVPTEATSEYFFRYDARMHGITSPALRHLTCKEGVEVLSELRPGKTPAAYRYENAAGQRFYVLAIDLYDSWVSGSSENFLKSYYRQADLSEAIEWIAGKPLPAFCAKNPNLYILAAKGDDAMAVALANVYFDDVLEPQIKLDKSYTQIRFLNCTGTLDGDRVTLSDIPPYGFAAFEVK